MFVHHRESCVWSGTVLTALPSAITYRGSGERLYITGRAASSQELSRQPYFQPSRLEVRVSVQHGESYVQSGTVPTALLSAITCRGSGECLSSMGRAMSSLELAQQPYLQPSPLEVQVSVCTPWGELCPVRNCACSLTFSIHLKRFR